MAPEHTGPKSESFRVTVGVLKNKLRSSIPGMSDTLKMRIQEAIALEMAPIDGMCTIQNVNFPMTADQRVFTNRKTQTGSG